MKWLKLKKNSPELIIKVKFPFKRTTQKVKHIFFKRNKFYLIALSTEKEEKKYGS
jgi:hypothetical protein